MFNYLFFDNSSPRHSNSDIVDIKHQPCVDENVTQYPETKIMSQIMHVDIPAALKWRRPWGGAGTGCTHSRWGCRSWPRRRRAWACRWPCRSAHRSLPEPRWGSWARRWSNMEQLEIEQRAGELITERAALLASVDKSIRRWREHEETERGIDCVVGTWWRRGPDGTPCTPSRTHLWPWRGWCGAPSPAGSGRCSGNLPRLIPTRPRCAKSSGTAGKMFAWLGGRRSLWSKIHPGCAWTQVERERRREREETKQNKGWRHLSRWALEAFRAEVMEDSFTYSPSAMHSNSSTCPLNTILELVGPDGMRKVGFLSSAGSSIVTHTQRELLPALLHASTTGWRSRPGADPSLSLSFLLRGLMKPLSYNGSAMHGHWATSLPLSHILWFYCHVVFYCTTFCGCLQPINPPLGL